ncbi:MAG: ABC transporter permease [Planctomycetes bacterium]|nr:ABC transporter permease [Planctomycetota bacterium]
MYKLFLCLRYLRRRYIAMVAIIGMALCVFMVLVVVSVMNGFLGLVENAAKGMMGDVVVDAAAEPIAYYDEFIGLMKAKLPDDILAATPVIYSYGLLRIGPEYTQTVRVIGVRLPEAAAVSTFTEGLYPPQLKASPAFAVPASMRKELLARLGTYRTRIDQLQSIINDRSEQLAAEQEKDPARQDKWLIGTLERNIANANSQISSIRRLYGYDEELPGIILGVDIPGTTVRDEVSGSYTRYVEVGQKVQLMVIPTGRTVTALTEPVKKRFTFVGDSRMGIYQIDSGSAYVDFDTLAELIDLGPRPDADTGQVDPGRCSQIQIKVKGTDNETHLRAVAEKVRLLWEQFSADRGEADLLARPTVQTWREKQSQYIGPIEKQRDLVTIMFAIISLVAVVLVFAIFYMMVVQKTKDIGILKSIGASSGGVAVIYLMYGSAVGLVGSVIGAVGSYWFVRRINPIHDWIATTFSWRVFDRRAYLFDQIPNTIQLEVIAGVVVGAMLAGLLGAMLPAVRAARMQPVEALRYE